MNKIVANKTIKRNILGYLMLCWLLVGLSGGTLQAATTAATVEQSDTQESYDYTLQQQPGQVSPIINKPIWI